MSELQQLLKLRAVPVAIAFRPTAPAGVAHVATPEPASCGYWRRAAAGEVFYTDAEDHKRCPVGAHTHGVSLTPAESQELQGLVKTMVDLEYLSMEDVPSIPTRKEPFAYAVYAPIDRSPVPPDVVLIHGNARQLPISTSSSATNPLNPGSPIEAINASTNVTAAKGINRASGIRESSPRSRVCVRS